MPLGLPYRAIWCIDFEFNGHDGKGENPTPVCMVAREVGTGQLIRLWQDQLAEPPFAVGDDTLVVAYVAQAEMSCYLELGWPIPCRIIDLPAEFRVVTNGLTVSAGRGLLGALSWHHIPGITKDEKKHGRELALQGTWTDAERRELLDYCQTDVDALPALLEAMLPAITITPQGFAQALLRGRATVAIARMERTGVPIDTETLAAIRSGWSGIKSQLIKEVDADYGVYENGSFRAGLFAKYLEDRDIPWPRTATGLLKTDDDTFRDMAKVHPKLMQLKELRHSLSQLRVEKLAVGGGRNRTNLWPFTAVTGRNAPSGSQFIFGPSVWLRGLIKPGPGMAVAYLDYSSQEVVIAAALSGDPILREALTSESGDPYIDFAVRAGFAPEEARSAPEGVRKGTYGAVREMCKVAVLGTNYGMGPTTLALRTGTTVVEAKALLQMLARAYPTYAEWQEKSINSALLRGYMSTVFGWRFHLTSDTEPAQLRNWPMQSHGSEMLRIACCLATERGVSVCAPVHDAMLIEAPIDLIDDVVAVTREAMTEAAVAVLGPDVPMGTDLKIVRYPDRYADKRGQMMWNRVMNLLDRFDAM